MDFPIDISPCNFSLLEILCNWWFLENTKMKSSKFSDLGRHKHLSQQMTTVVIKITRSHLSWKFRTVFLLCACAHRAALVLLKVLAISLWWADSRALLYGHKIVFEKWADSRALLYRYKTQ